MSRGCTEPFLVALVQLRVMPVIKVTQRRLGAVSWQEVLIFHVVALVQAVMPMLKVTEGRLGAVNWQEIVILHGALVDIEVGGCCFRTLRRRLFRFFLFIAGVAQS